MGVHLSLGGDEWGFIADCYTGHVVPKCCRKKRAMKQLFKGLDTRNKHI